MTTQVKSVKRMAWFRRIARLRRQWGETYQKRTMTLVLYNAIGWVWCSYVLAWFGRYEIAQSLSQTAVTAILGVFITYAAKSGMENVSKNGYVGKQEPAGKKTGFSKLGTHAGKDDLP